MKKAKKIMMAAATVAVTATTAFNVVNAVVPTVATSQTPVGANYYWKFSPVGEGYQVFGATGDTTSVPGCITLNLKGCVAGESGIILKNVGTYEEQNVSVKITLENWETLDGATGEPTVSFNDSGALAGILYNGDVICNLNVKLEAFFSADGEEVPLQLGGMLTMSGSAKVGLEDKEILTLLKSEKSTVTHFEEDGFTMIDFNYPGDTDLIDSAIDLVFDTSKSGDAALHIQLFGEGEDNFVEFLETSVVNLNRPMIIETLTKRVTAGDTVAYIATLNDEDQYDAPAFVVELDKDVDVTDVMVLNRNNSNVTSNYKVEKAGNKVTVSAKDSTNRMGLVKSVVVNGKVKENPACANKLSEDGYKLVAKTSSGASTATNDQVNLFFTITGDEKAEHVTFEGAEEVDATLNTVVTVKPDAGYKLTKVVVDGVEQDLEDLKAGESFDAEFLNIKADHEISAEAEQIPAKLIVRYVDAETDKVLDEVEEEGFMLDKYATEAIEIEGYELDDSKLPTNASGKLEAEEVVVTYYYNEIKPVDTGDMNVFMTMIAAIASVFGIVITKKNLKKD